MKMFDAASQLESYRQTIDNIDAALIHILAECFRCTNEVGLLKARHDLAPVDKNREDQQFLRLRSLAKNAKIDPDFVEDLMKFIIKEVVQRHNQIATEYRSAQAHTT